MITRSPNRRSAFPQVRSLYRVLWAAALVALVLIRPGGPAALAQPPQFSTAVRAFIAVDAPVVALTNARVIDGTGAPARAGQTIVIRNGSIAELGDGKAVKVPEGATVLDLTGKTVMPGIVMVVPGFSNHRQIELLVEAGFSPVEAIRIGTLNGATYLGRDKQVGSIAVGKQADLVVVNGDPSANIADLRNVDTVFKGGVGFDPGKLIESVAGRVGLW